MSALSSWFPGGVDSGLSLVVLNWEAIGDMEKDRNITIKKPRNTHALILTHTGPVDLRSGRSFS